jgi:hypothetical protein
MNPCSRGATPPLAESSVLPCRGRGRNGANIGCNCHPYAAETFKITFVQPYLLRYAEGGNFVRILQTAASSTFASGPRSLSAPLAAGLHRYFRRQSWSMATPQRAILPRTLPRKQLGLHFFGTPPPRFRGGCREGESIQHCERTEQSAEDPAVGTGVGGWHQ